VVAFLLFLLMIAVTQGLMRLGRRGEEAAAG
jgi:hypothetical protein